MHRWLALLLLTLPLAAGEADDGQDEAETKPKKGPWSVDDPGGPYRTLEFDTEEGTWISVDVAPDGKTLVFDLLGDLYTLPIGGGEATRITSGLAYDVQPRWSPGGKRIVFCSDRGGGDNIWIVAADGSGPAAVTKEDYRLLNNPVWHPDGDYVVAKKHFTSRRSLGAGEMWMYRLPDGGAGVQLTKRRNDQQDAGEPDLSPDGRYLYWSEDMSPGPTFQYNKDPNGIIYVIRRLDLETGEITDLISRPGGATTPRAGPDGKTLAFVRRERSKSVLALYDLATGRVRDLWDGLTLDQQEGWAIFGPHPGYSWTPDGRALVVSAKGRLWRVDAATGAATPIPFKAQVSQRIVATQRIAHSVAGDSFRVKVIRWPQVAGDTMVFQALGYLYRLAPGASAPERLTTQVEHFEFAPRLTPDRRAVVYTTWHDRKGGSVRLVNLDGTGGRVLVDRPGHYASADLAPDGEAVVYHRAEGDNHRGLDFAAEPGIYLARPGAKAERLALRGRSPRFSGDGTRVLFQARTDNRAALVSVDLHGGDPRTLATSKHAVDFALSPDGRWLAFEERWSTYLVPFPPGPATLEVKPKMKAVPVRKLSRDGGTYLSWSRDSRTVRWSLGPEVHAAAVDGEGTATTAIDWRVPADAPATDLYLVGARIVPMHDRSVIGNGTIHVRGNRIVAVGADVEVPEGAATIDVSGTTILPGLVDVHSHTGAASHRIHPQQSWALCALLAFGVTTVHDPSNDTQMIYAESELVRAGLRLGPRILSTGTILYGAEGEAKAVINSYEDAAAAIRRTAAWGPRSVKSYNQPRREQRQQVLKAARDLGIMVMPEGGSTLHYNMTHLLDGHTTLEHAVPVAPLHEPELRLLAECGTSYTPTLVVAYGGFWGENYWYAKTRVWEHERLLRFVPRSLVDARARRRTLATDESEYHHVRLARTAADALRRGGNVEIGAHGQMQGLGSHWELWMLAQGGLTPHEALRCATWGGAHAICLEHEIGALKPGYLADLIVVEGDPLENVRDSERVRYTMANGRLYDARTLEQIAPDRRPLPPGPPLDTIR